MCNKVLKVESAEKSAQKWIGSDRLGSDRSSLLLNHQHDASFSTPFLQNGSLYVLWCCVYICAELLTIDSARGAAANAAAWSWVRALPIPRETITYKLTCWYRTRKAKEVNFGFSFGSPALGLPAPAPIASVPEAQKPARTQTAPNTTPRSLKVSQPGSQARGIERTPGSARNKLPERPSTYEIPSSDDRSEQIRSNKRRKISMLWTRPVCYARNVG